MRPQDRLLLAELHPEDVETLRREFSRDRNTSVQHMDGYHAIKAHLPLKERRGMVLIDPPFEVTDEFERMTDGAGDRPWPLADRHLCALVPDQGTAGGLALP